MKKMAVVMVMVCLLGGLMVQPSFAAWTWYNVTVRQAGTANGGFLIFNVTNPLGATPAYINLYELNTEPDANRNLATALTAMSMSLTVWILSDGTDGGGLSKIILTN